jgi:hypothetical protein
MSEIRYWMFGNALLLLLDIEAVFLLSLHLWLKRRQFKLVHMVSLAFLIYLLGQVFFRTLYWELWREITDPADFSLVAGKLLQLFRMPLVKVASLLNMVGLIMIVAVLTWNMRWLWIYATLLTFMLAFASVWL